jgi:hypothetical protein
MEDTGLKPLIGRTKWRWDTTKLNASRLPDLWRPEAERLPREPDPIRAGRARLRRALERSRRRFATPLPGKRWL